MVTVLTDGNKVAFFNHEDYSIILNNMAYSPPAGEGRKAWFKRQLKIAKDKGYVEFERMFRTCEPPL